MKSPERRRPSVRKLVDRQEDRRAPNFQATFEHVGVGIAHTATDGRFIRVNDRFCEMLGYCRDQMLGRPFAEFTHPEDIGSNQAALQQLARGEIASCAFEKRYVHADGRAIWAELNVSAARLASGEISHMITIMQDIGYRKGVEYKIDYYVSRLSGLLLLQTQLADGGPDIDEVMDLVVNKACELTGADFATLQLEKDGRLTHRAATNNARLVPDVVIQAADNLFRSALQDGNALLCNDAEADPRVDRAAACTAGIRSVMAAPMRHAGEAVGILGFYAPQPDTFSSEDLSIARLLAGIAGSEIRRRSAAAELDETLRFAHRTLDALTKHICVIDQEGVIIAVNRAWREFANSNNAVLQQVLEGSNYLQVCDRASGADADEALAFARGARAVLAGEQEQFVLEYPCHSPDEQRWFQVRVTRFDDDGPARAVVAHENISRRKRQEETVRRHSRQQGLIAAFGRNALASTDLEELFQMATTCVCEGLDVEFARLLQLAPDNRSMLVRAGTGWDPAWIGWRTPGTDQALLYSHLLNTGEPVIVDDFSTESRFKASEMLTAHGIASAAELLIAGTGGRFGTLGAFSPDPRRFSTDDIDFLQSMANIVETAIERQRSEEKMAYIAQFDSLTGLPNRNLLRDRLAQALPLADRNGWRIGVLIVDLDRFKVINDTLGHAVGDHVLREVARRLQDCVRSGDTVARLSADEFAIVLTNLAQPEDAGRVAQKIIEACRHPFQAGGGQTYLTTSVGVALYPGDGMDADTLLRHADIAAHRAKEQGRDNGQFYLPQMNERALQRLQTEAALRGALERDEFLLHYQPKADLYTGAICGFEALLRWQHPERGLVPPGEFIGTLEDTGLIVPVGAWALRNVCRQIARWQQAGLKALPVAVNLSARQFQQKDLETTIRQVLTETGIDPHLLELELTESLLMHDAEAAAQTLRNLRSIGVRLAVDDFGTGYSSLAYLKRFPIDSLKIDRAFIRDCIADPDDAMIATAVINLAHSLKLKVVAEGVETEAQLNFLRSHGCDQIQGYYFARPLDITFATKALVEGRRLQGSIYEGDAHQSTLLLVDDNADDLELGELNLAPDGYRILTARTPRAALDVLANHRVDAVISDQNMPGMAGADFLAAVRKLYPEVLRIILSGSDDPELLPKAVNEAGIHQFLSKHWDGERLRQAVREACRLSQPTGQ